LPDPWQEYRERRARERREAAEREEALRWVGEDDDQVAMLSADTRQKWFRQRLVMPHDPPHCPPKHQEGKETARPTRSVRPTTTAMSDQSADDTTRRSGHSSRQLPVRQDLRAWAAELAATLPPLTQSQVAAVARLAARLDAASSEESAV
jgi:hypothetical protein